MKTLFGFVIVAISSLCFCETSSAQSGFQIIYMADTKYAKDSLWVKNIKADWHATGVNLRIRWADVVDDSFNRNWTEVDSAIQELDKRDLDIYIRVSLIFTRHSWFSHFIYNNFHRRKNDIPYYNPYDYGEPYHSSSLSSRRIFNFITPAPRDSMKTFFQEVVQHLDQSPYRNRIKLIVPAISPDDESDYPSQNHEGLQEMTGYTVPEKAEFRAYLTNKYENIDSLNKVWGPPNHSSFNSINASNFNWEKLRDPDSTAYIKPKGRIDWIDFRTSELKKFLEELQSLTKTYSNPDFQFGLQFGSFYDERILLRGFYDPTSLLEKADYVITDDVAQFHPNFKFSADFSRSLCRYWDWKKGRTGSNRIKFATETNWPDYVALHPDTLNKYWERQVEAFYDRGASALFISHWGTTDTGDLTAQRVRSREATLLSDYQAWANALGGRFKNQVVQTVTHSSVTHLSCEQGLYFRADSGFSGSIDYKYTYGFNIDTLGISVSDTIRSYEFPFYRFIRPRGAYGPYNSSYGDWGDIITNYMLANSPTYVTSNYHELYFTASSYIIPERAYVNLMRNNMKNVLMVNATFFVWGADTGYAFTPGIRNEYLERRSPIHLVWRTRPDLQEIWPDANQPAPESGWVSDFVLWAHYNGCGGQQDTTYSPQREYPHWVILEPDGKYNYDKNIRGVWDRNSTLQTTYTNAHDKNSPPPKNLIEWAKTTGYASYPIDLKNYNHWPYIGGGISVKISGPSLLADMQAGTWLATVSGGSGTTTYQWYVSFDNGLEWTTLGTSDTLKYNMNGQNFRLRCNITRSGGSATDIYDVEYLIPKISETATIPKQFELYNNYPNPFNPSTHIRFDLPENGKISLFIFDILGRKVKELSNDYFDAGSHNIVWNGTNDIGQVVGTGVYFAIFKFFDSKGDTKFQKIKKLMLLK